jgi:hypothetical protein
MRRILFGGWLIVALGVVGALPADPAGSPGQSALEAAARDGKYLFDFFSKDEEDATRTMR